jgi:hypothetical protein
MNEQKFNTWVRRVVRVFAVGAWVLSIYFSADGFGFQVPGFFLVGVFLGGLVTILEIVLNKGVKSMTLRLGGLLAYVFGWYTNFIGLSLAMGQPDFAADPKQMVIPVILGLFLEIIPEPLFLWSDLIARLMEMTHKNQRGSMHYPTPHYPPVLEGKRGRKERQQFSR